MDDSGNLYGTTAFRGSNSLGTAFELAQGSGTITTLVSFNGANASNPSDARFAFEKPFHVTITMENPE